MKKREEKLYYQWIEDVIKNRTITQSFFDHKSKEEHDVEILLLVNHIQSKNPHLLEQLLARTVNTTELSHATRNNMYNFLGKTEKGTMLTWKDKNGTEFIFVNAGEGSAINKKRIVILGDTATKSNIKKTLFTEILRKDVEYIYRRIQKKERKSYKTNSKTFLTELFSTKKEDIIHSAGSFERNFKKMIRFQGYAASPMITAQIMIKTMNGSDKKQLQNTFSAMGIKNSEDLQNILSRWKIEALTKKQIPIKKVIDFNRGQSHSINM